MDKSSQKPEMSVRRSKFLDLKLTEISNEAIVQGMNPFLCVIILQTYDGLTIRGAGDSRIVPNDEKLETLLAKMKAIVGEYCYELPTLERVPGSGSS